MDTSWLGDLLFNPFTIGLAFGLIGAVFVWLRGCVKIREINRDRRKLREHLQTKLEIDAVETERRKQEMENLKQERDNLRNMVQSLNQKPGRAELRQLQVFQRAVDVMMTKSPGFAPVWQMTVREAEEEIVRAERGFIPFIRRMTGSSSPGRGPLELEQHSGR